MSSSSPGDLAVTFRSIPRRLGEARGDAPLSVTAGITTELDEQIGIAARLMHAGTEPGAIADAIEAVPADSWDEATLTSLRSTALDIGRLLRAIAAVAEGDGD
ncbi:MAG: hypothetical protein M3P52_07160 [Actinomycetota bacterium]|nr:hypothetical protein [Actinomycetota bacterium]